MATPSPSTRYFFKFLSLFMNVKILDRAVMTVLYFEVIINTVIYKVFIIAGVGLEKFYCSSAGAVQVVAWGRRRGRGRRRRRPVFTFGSEQLHRNVMFPPYVLNIGNLDSWSRIDI